MWAKACFALVLFVLSGCYDGSAREFLEQKELAVKLESTIGRCGGTAISRNAILTAEHCLPSDAKVEKVKIDGREAAILDRLYDGNEHAILVVSISFKKFARFGPVPKIGDTVFLWGNGTPMESYREAVVSSFSEQCEVVVHLRDCLYTAPLFKNGDSGSALFDRNGRVVGVASHNLIGMDGVVASGSPALRFRRDALAYVENRRHWPVVEEDGTVKTIDIEFRGSRAAVTPIARPVPEGAFGPKP